MPRSQGGQGSVSEVRVEGGEALGDSDLFFHQDTHGPATSWLRERGYGGVGGGKLEHLYGGEVLLGELAFGGDHGVPQLAYTPSWSLSPACRNGGGRVPPSDEELSPLLGHRAGEFGGGGGAQGPASYPSSPLPGQGGTSNQPFPPRAIHSSQGWSSQRCHTPPSGTLVGRRVTGLNRGGRRVSPGPGKP